MKSILIIFTFCFSSILTAQNLNANMDSLYAEIINLNTKQNGIQTLGDYVKCGFGLFSQAVQNYEKFSPKQQSKISEILQRPELQASIVTPGGFFRIHYDTAGNDAPNYNNLGLQQSLILLAQACDSSYNFEVNVLGYPSPPTDNGEGGDNLYDIYIDGSLNNVYGYTLAEDPIGGEKYTSYIVIHNDYENFPTKGIDAARVTVAHELHHAIQMGNYVLRYSLDGFFYELTSSAMEDFVYDNINDYYNYLPFYFNSPENAFGCIECSFKQQQYGLAVWGIFMKDIFGYDIIKRQWELMPQVRAMQAINISIQENGSSFRKEFAEFGIWLYFTGYRSVPGKYFEEAVNYPLLDPMTSIEFNSPVKSVRINAFPTSQNFIRFTNPSNNDTLSVLIANSNIIKGIDSITSRIPFEYSLFNSPADGRTKIKNSYYAQFTAANPSFWTETDILNNKIVKSDTSITSPQTAVNYPYPNPFYYSNDYFIKGIRIPVETEVGTKVDYNIYSSAMELIYSSRQSVTIGELGNAIIIWEPLDNKGNRLASGVYIYFTKEGDNTTTGKIVIFNE